jgi:hypothetical protein
MFDDWGERIREFFRGNDKKRASLGEVREIAVGLRAGGRSILESFTNTSLVMKTGFIWYATRGIDEFLRCVLRGN